MSRHNDYNQRKGRPMGEDAQMRELAARSVAEKRCFTCGKPMEDEYIEFGYRNEGGQDVGAIVCKPCDRMYGITKGLGFPGR